MKHVRFFFLLLIVAGIAYTAYQYNETSNPLVSQTQHQDLSSMNAPFPHSYTSETDLPSYMSVRVEGQPSGYVTSNIIGYTRKASNHKFTAPKEEIEHFNQQIALQMWMKQNNQTVSNPTRLAFAGDVMWLRTGWSEFMNQPLFDYLNSFHGFFANLETMVSAEHKVETLLPATAKFNSPPDIVNQFDKPNGGSLFTALSLANNHVLDFDDSGLANTIDFLKSKNIPFSGSRKPESTEKPYIVLNINGLKVGFYATTYGVNDGAKRMINSKMQINWVRGYVPLGESKPDLSEVAAVLKQMEEEKVDFKIVSFHWGHEYEYYPDPSQLLLARDIVRLGADMIMGSHPHVPQPNEVCFVNGYEKSLQTQAELSALHVGSPGACMIEDDTGKPRKALIVYSLGNFLSNMIGFKHEIGWIQSIELFRNAQGFVDWQQYDSQFVRNLKEDKRVNGKRQLVLMKPSLAAATCGEATCNSEQMKHINFLKNHLGAN